MLIGIRKIIFFGLILSWGISIFFGVNKVQAISHNPGIANFYLNTPISASQANELAGWDVLVLHMMAGKNSASAIQKIRQLNPNIIILAYIASEEFPVTMYKQWDSQNTGLFAKQLSGITDDMWLRDANGNHVVFWGDNWMLNATDYPSSGKRWNEYLADFAVNSVLSDGLWDGIFYDNVWTGVSWINGSIDANRDGRVDSASDLDTAWNKGMEKLFDLTRQKAGKKIYLVGNGDRGFYGKINGIYFENFTTNGYISWEEKMKLYKKSVSSSVSPTVAIIGNTSAASSPQKDYQKMRFGLGSALMENGYYAYDAGSYSHAERWWYDEYDVDLGDPIGNAVSLNGYTDYKKDVWRREFSNGLALVNSTAETKTVDLGGEYEKISGTQDTSVNNGTIVSRVSVKAADGLLMLKTFQVVNNLVFNNGGFISFFDYLGQKVRNGFFSFDEKYSGGAQLYYGDLDGLGDQEKIISQGFRFEIFNNQGIRWYNDFPYGGNFNGTIRVAVGRLFNQAQDQILIAPSTGGKVVMFNYHGKFMQRGWYPLGEKYKNGLSVAIAHLNGPTKVGQAIFGTGSGVAGQVLVYDNRLSKLQKSFYPYGQSFKGGVYVGGGDVNNDGVDEIITGSMTTSQPIRIFDKNGKKISEFKSDGFFGENGSMVGTVDINFDGKLDIAVIQ